jgi:hypothetical protein
MHPVVTCGWCGSSDTRFETVDIGVGFQQVTAAECAHCGATQISPDDLYDDNCEIDPEDVKRGWYAGSDTEDTIKQDEVERIAREHMFASDYNNGERMLIGLLGTMHAGFKRLSFSRPVFQTICGRESTVCDRPDVEAITCFECISKGTL